METRTHFQRCLAELCERTYGVDSIGLAARKVRDRDHVGLETARRQLLREAATLATERAETVEDMKSVLIAVIALVN